MNKEFLESDNRRLREAIKKAMSEILKEEIKDAYNILYFALDKHSAAVELIDTDGNEKDI